MDNLKDIANILPEGLDESTVETIFELVDSTINEQVSEKIGLLEAKVNAYLRTKVDQLKEQALTELSEENEVFRNARLFESVRTLMTLELTGADEDSAVSEIATSHGELQEEFDTISEQVGLLAIENEKLQSTIKVLSSKASIQEATTKELEDQKEQLIEEVANLEAVNEEKFISSEQALVISLADKEINEEQAPFQNEFLNNEVMRFMPSSQN
jgi:hypothetical protein